MKPSDMEDRARRIVQVAALTRIVAPMVREAINDRKVRAAAGEAFGTGRKVYEDLRGADARIVASRMARDERLQSDVAAVLRSAVAAVDEGIATTRRRARRRFLKVMVAGAIAACLVGVALRRRFACDPADGSAPEVHASETASPSTEPVAG